MIDHAKKPVQHGERHFSLLPDTWSTADEYRNRVHTDGSPDPFGSRSENSPSLVDTTTVRTLSVAPPADPYSHPRPNSVPPAPLPLSR